MEKPHVPTGQRRTGSLAGLLPIVAIGCLITASGCSTYLSECRAILAPYEQSKCRCLTEVRANMTARKIWRDKYAHCYGHRGNAKDIKAGFIDGFVSTALGGSGCPPLTPPQKYCSIASLTHRKVGSQCWFEGWPLGVAAAESAGACDWCRTTICPELNACMIDQGCAPGCKPCEAPCGCGTKGCSGNCGVPVMPTVNLGVDQDGAIIVEESFDELPAANAPLIMEPENAETGLVPAIGTPEAAPEIKFPSADPAPNAGDAPAPEPKSQSDIDRDDVTTVPSDAPVARGSISDSQDDSAAASGPVEMPNLQVSYDLDDDAWLFSNVTQAILEKDSSESPSK